MSNKDTRGSSVRILISPILGWGGVSCLPDDPVCYTEIVLGNCLGKGRECYYVLRSSFNEEMLSSSDVTYTWTVLPLLVSDQKAGVKTGQRTAHELIFIVIIFHSQRFSYNGSIFPFLWHIGMAALSPWHTLVIFSSTKGCSLPPKVIWFSELHTNFSWNRLHGVHRHAVKVALLYVLYDPLPWLAGSTAGLKTVYSIHTSYRPWNRYLGKKTLNWRHTQQLLL